VATRKLSVPKKAWLQLVTTNHAREKLRTQLRKLGVLQTISGAANVIRQKTQHKKN
jgi:(p)ppGpp synthase/HD superfamily hydrolase